MTSHALRCWLRPCEQTKRENANSDESQLLYGTLRDMNLSKLVAQDVPLFLAMLQDVFANVAVPVSSVHPAVAAAIDRTVRAAGLVDHDRCVPMSSTSMHKSRGGSRRCVTGAAVCWLQLDPEGYPVVRNAARAARHHAHGTHGRREVAHLRDAPVGAVGAVRRTLQGIRHQPEGVPRAGHVRRDGRADGGVDAGRIQRHLGEVQPPHQRVRVVDRVRRARRHAVGGVHEHRAGR